MKNKWKNLDREEIKSRIAATEATRILKNSKKKFIAQSSRQTQPLNRASITVSDIMRSIHNPPAQLQSTTKVKDDQRKNLEEVVNQPLINQNQSEEEQLDLQIRQSVDEVNVDNNKEDLLAPLAKKPLTYHDFFRTTDTSFQIANAACFLGFVGLYTTYYFKPAYMPLATVHSYSYAWNYLLVISYLFMHIYNIIQICRSHDNRDKTRKIAMEVVGMATTLAFAAGTTLSLLANLHVFTGLMFTICGPLGPVTAGLYTVFLGFVDLVNCYKVSRQLKLEVLLRDRLKRFIRISENLEKHETNKINDEKDWINERDAMREQFIALARVGIKNGEIDEKQLKTLLEAEGFKAAENLKGNVALTEDKQFAIEKLKQKPTAIEEDVFYHVRARLHEKVRAHAYNAGFWISAGVGSTLLALTTLFPPLLIPAIALIVIGVIIKAVEVFEIDKRVYNFAHKNNPALKQRVIERDNLLTNLLARCDKEKQVIKESLQQFKEAKELSVVNDVISKKFSEKKSKSFSEEYRTKMRIAYELTRHKHQGTEEQFYQQFFKLPWWQRRKILNLVMDKKVKEVVMASPNYTKIANHLTQENQDNLIAKQCREEYGGLFCKKKSISESENQKNSEVGVNGFAPQGN